jgi:hypothetical protein
MHPFSYVTVIYCLCRHQWQSGSIRDSQTRGTWFDPSVRRNFYKEFRLVAGYSEILRLPSESIDKLLTYYGKGKKTVKNAEY